MADNGKRDDGSLGAGDRNAIVFVTPDELAQHQAPQNMPQPAAQASSPISQAVKQQTSTWKYEEEETASTSVDSAVLDAAVRTSAVATEPAVSESSDLFEGPPETTCPRCDTKTVLDEQINSCDFCGYFIGEVSDAPVSSGSEESVLETVNRVGTRKRVDGGALAVISIFGLLFCGAVIGVFSSFAEPSSDSADRPDRLDTIVIEPELQPLPVKRSQPQMTSTERIQAFIEMVRKTQGKKDGGAAYDHTDANQTLDAEDKHLPVAQSSDSFALSDEEAMFLFPESSDELQNETELISNLWECTRYGDDLPRITNNPNAGVDVNCVPSTGSRGSYNKLSPGQTITW
ncbi:MAG: hypothetical protein KDD66_01825 [Bdellovibrionales bacterium]|nr:hypothetical protein [Bdellovibrionales bacterium]